MIHKFPTCSVESVDGGPVPRAHLGLEHAQMALVEAAAAPLLLFRAQRNALQVDRGASAPLHTPVQGTAPTALHIGLRRIQTWTRVSIECGGQVLALDS